MALSRALSNINKYISSTAAVTTFRRNNSSAAEERLLKTAKYNGFLTKGFSLSDLIYFTGKDYVFRFDVPGIRQANLRCTATGSKFSFTAQEPKTHRFGIGICEPRYYEGQIELDPLVYQPERFTAKVNNGVLLIQIPKILGSAGFFKLLAQSCASAHGPTVSNYNLIQTKAQELGPCVKNCILFSRQSFLSYNWKDDNHIRSSKLEKNELDIGVYHLHDAEHSGAIESYAGYSDSLWPLPSWIWPIDRLKRIGMVEAAIDEILDRITKDVKKRLERVVGRYDGLVQPVVQEQLRGILKLKKVAIGFQEEEIDFMTKLRRDHVLSSAMSMLRKRDALLFNIEEQATTEVELSLKYISNLNILPGQ